MKVYDNSEVQDFRKMEWVDADIAQELYDTLGSLVQEIREIKSLKYNYPILDYELELAEAMIAKANGDG